MYERKAAQVIVTKSVTVQQTAQELHFGFVFAKRLIA
jgi:hypothetical protein